MYCLPILLGIFILLSSTRAIETWMNTYFKLKTGTFFKMMSQILEYLSMLYLTLVAELELHSSTLDTVYAVVCILCMQKHENGLHDGASIRIFITEKLRGVNNVRGIIRVNGR